MPTPRPSLNAFPPGPATPEQIGFALFDFFDREIDNEEQMRRDASRGDGDDYAATFDPDDDFYVPAATVGIALDSARQMPDDIILDLAGLADLVTATHKTDGDHEQIAEQFRTALASLAARHSNRELADIPHPAMLLADIPEERVTLYREAGVGVSEAVALETGPAPVDEKALALLAGLRKGD